MKIHIHSSHSTIQLVHLQWKKAHVFGHSMDFLQAVFPKGTETLISFYIFVELNMPNVVRYKIYCERHR